MWWSPFLSLRCQYLEANHNLRAGVKKWNSRINILSYFLACLISKAQIAEELVSFDKDAFPDVRVEAQLEIHCYRAPVQSELVRTKGT